MKNKLVNKCSLAVLLTCSITACGSTVSVTTNINTNTATANSNAVSPLATNENANTAAQAAPKTAPDALVADLYEQDNAKNSPFFQTKSRALVDKYFTKATADMIWKDATTSKGEVGALDGDPLFDAQDTDIKNFKVGKAEIKDKTATVPVTFINFNEKKKINFALVIENGAWKISDIRYAEGTLVGYFKEDASSNSGDKTSNSPSGEFEGKYKIGETTCIVKPIKMAFEVKWEKGTGTEIFFFQDRANDKYIFASDPKTGKANVFSFDDENYNTGIFYRADGKQFPISRVK